MIPRILKTEIKNLLSQYPVTTILGPRQSGKSTLVRSLFPKRMYINLEAPDERKIIENDPREFLANIPKSGVIIDEIQRIPSLLSYIQVFVDEQDKNGQFILTGSHQLELHQDISQSLAGRTAILKLLPLSINELKSVNLDLDMEDCILSSISNDLGISHHTVKQWISILESSYVLIKIRPYFENIGKRVIKASKIYFTDPGLVCYLLGIENKTQLKRDPLKGNLFENMVVLELIKARYNTGKEHNLYFYRDNHQNEVDILFKAANKLTPIEIKSSKTFNLEFLKGLKFIDKLFTDRITSGYVIYSGIKEYKIDKFMTTNFKTCSNIVL